MRKILATSVLTLLTALFIALPVYANEITVTNESTQTVVVSPSTVAVGVAGSVSHVAPHPVVMTTQGLSDSQFNDWLIYYLYSGGISQVELDVIHYMNIERAAVGAPPLELCRHLAMASRFKSQEMVDLSYFAHTSPVYGNWTTIPVLLFDAYNVVSENLVRRVVRENIGRDLVYSWMGSPGHRENMLNPNHRTVGVGVVTALGVGVNFDGTPITDRYAAMGTAMFGSNFHFSDWMYAENLFPPACEICAWYGAQVMRMIEDPTSAVLRYTVNYFDAVIFIDYALRNYFEDDFEYVAQHLVNQLIIRGLVADTVHIITATRDLSRTSVCLVTPVGSRFYNLLNEKAIDW